MKVWALKIITVLVLGYLAVVFVQKSRNSIEAYDASYFANVAHNLAFQHRYGVFENGVFKTCPIGCSTGPAMLLPVAIGYRCCGDRPFLPGVVGAFLCLCVLAGAWSIAVPSDSRRSAWHFFSLLVAVIVMVSITVKQFDHLLFRAPQGDGLAGLWLLAMTVTLGRVYRGGRADFWSASSGICAALALNTKFVTALPLAAWAAFVALSAACRWIPRRAAVVGLAAFVAAQCGFVLFNVWQLGSLRAYLASLHEFAGYFKGYGSAGAAKPPLAQIFASHLEPYFSEFGWCGLVLLLPLLWSLICLYQLARGRGSADGWMGVGCTLQVVPLLAWWFFRSNLNWTRHIAPILVLMPFACHFLLCDAWQQTRWLERLGAARRAAYFLLRDPWQHMRSRLGRAAIIGVWPVSLVVACALSPSAVWDPPRPPSGPHARTVALLEFAHDIQSLRRAHPDARLWGAGFWQNWDVQLISHETSLDMLQPPPGASCPGRESHDYLIASDFFNWEHNPVTTWVVQRKENDIVASRGVFKLYHLKPAVTAAVKASASYEKPELAGKTLEGLKNGLDPVLRFTWGERSGTQEWVQYDFASATRVSAAEVYWFDNTAWGQIFSAPETWQLLYKDGRDWKAVEDAGKFTTKASEFNRVTFKPVSTTALRLATRLRTGHIGGILEWKVE